MPRSEFHLESRTACAISKSKLCILHRLLGYDQTIVNNHTNGGLLASDEYNDRAAREVSCSLSAAGVFQKLGDSIRATAAMRFCCESRSCF